MLNSLLNLLIPVILSFFHWALISLGLSFSTIIFFTTSTFRESENNTSFGFSL